MVCPVSTKMLEWISIQKLSCTIILLMLLVLFIWISKSCLDPISDHKCSRQNRNNPQHRHGQAHQVVKIYLTHSAVQTEFDSPPPPPEMPQKCNTLGCSSSE